MTIQDLDALKEVSFFNPDYLHLDYSDKNRAAMSGKAHELLYVSALRQSIAINFAADKSIAFLACNTTNINWRSLPQPWRRAWHALRFIATEPDKEKTRIAARDLARVSLLIARHILVGAHCASLKVDELELLYDDADFL